MQLRNQRSSPTPKSPGPPSSDWSVSSPSKRSSPRKRGPELGALPTSDDPSEVDILSESGGPVERLNEDFTLQGLLADGEEDIDDSRPLDADRQLFESSLLRAESALQQHRIKFPSSSGGMRLNQNRRLPQPAANNFGGRGKGKDLFSVLKQRTQSSATPVCSIRKVYFGTDFAITPWYSAPYPSEYHSESGELWICEFCLKYMKRACTAQRHLHKCHGRLPPGDEIYRDSQAGISVFEVNGREAKLYCQNLCLLAKMFLDHKTLYYDVDPFLFYVLVEWRQLGTGRYLNSFVGYFSKEKVNPAGYNVSCILTMPHHQRKGYGSFLIDFSYLLSRREGRLGSPEKPLSDLGLFSYAGYWKQRLLAHLSSLLPPDLTDVRSRLNFTCSVQDISTATGMTENDVLGTLEYLRMLRFDPIQDPNTGMIRLRASITIDKAQIIAFRERVALKNPLQAREEYLRWEPYRCLR